MWKPTILHFHCHAINTAQKNKLETVQWKKPRKWNVIKDYYWYKQFFQISGLCGPQFLSHLPKHFTHLCRALYGDAISVDSLAAGSQQKHLQFTFSIKALPFHSSASIRVQKTHLLILEMVKLLKIKRNGFFQWDSIPIFVSRTLKTRKFKMVYFRNETSFGAGNLYKDLFSIVLQPSVDKNSYNLAFLTLHSDDVTVKTINGV